jgi:capsular polysaccharide biosynthesis protein
VTAEPVNGPAPAIAPPPEVHLSPPLRRRWPLVLGVTLAITLLAWLLATMQPKRYRASAIAAVTPIGENLSASDVLRGVDSLDRRVVVASLAALASAPVTQRAVQAHGDETIVASVLPNTNLFRVEVEGRDAARAMQIANRVPAVLNAQATRMYRMYGVTLMSEAGRPGAPAVPRIGRAVVTGLVLGLLAGIAVAWLLDRRRSAS